MHQGETHHHSFHSQAKVRFTYYLPHQNRPPCLVSIEGNIIPHPRQLVLRICSITEWGCSFQWLCRCAIFNR